MSDPVSERKVERNHVYTHAFTPTYACTHLNMCMHIFLMHTQNASCLTHELMLAGAPAKTDVGACSPTPVLTFGYLHSPKACVLGALSQPVVRLGGDGTLRK